MKACIVVPSYQAETSLPGVVHALRAAMPEVAAEALIVVDDGSTDGTSESARALGCTLLRHGRNMGKGVALRTGFEGGRARGYDVALTVDADGQHPAEEARRVLFAEGASRDALVLGVRSLERDGAPRKNIFSNGISNFFISHFAGQPLGDTQCGLRRYPIARTLALGARGTGYEFEAEILLRASWTGLPIVELPVRVLYPEDRVTHFRVSRDPWRIVKTVVVANVDRRMGNAARGHGHGPRAGGAEA